MARRILRTQHHKVHLVAAGGERMGEGRYSPLLSSSSRQAQYEQGQMPAIFGHVSWSTQATLADFGAACSGPAQDCQVALGCALERELCCAGFQSFRIMRPVQRGVDGLGHGLVIPHRH